MNQILRITCYRKPASIAIYVYSTSVTAAENSATVLRPFFFDFGFIIQHCNEYHNNYFLKHVRILPSPLDAVFVRLFLGVVNNIGSPLLTSCNIIRFF